MSLINKETLCGLLADKALEAQLEDECTELAIKECLSVVRQMPEAVVRCRECKHWKSSGSKAGNSFSDMEYIGGCEFTNYCRSESDFCSYGERKEGAD